MNNSYKNFKEGSPLKGLARVSAILIMIMVWILIDKGNIYGQNLSNNGKFHIKASVDVAEAQLAKAGGDEGGLLEGADEGTDFQVYPNPVKQDLVFDFEFTVRETIPYEVISPLGRLVASGQFEPGVSTQMLDFKHLKSGMYIIRLEIGGETKVTRVIKQ